MKIKILEAYHGEGCYECGGDVDYRITDWDEVTDKEYYQLCEWAIKKNKKVSSYSRSRSRKYYIITVYNPESEPVPTAISEYIEMMKKEKVVEETRKLAAKKAAKTREQKKIDKERKEYEELNKKYGKAKEKEGVQ